MIKKRPTDKGLISWPNGEKFENYDQIYNAFIIITDSKLFIAENSIN